MTITLPSKSNKAFRACSTACPVPNCSGCTTISTLVFWFFAQASTAFAPCPVTTTMRSGLSDLPVLIT